MKLRERPRPELAAVPPPELRLWEDPSREQQHRGDGLGLGVFGSREAWLAARRAWEAAHGTGIGEWFCLVCEDALHRCGLAEMNRVFSLYHVEDDAREDPRLTA